VPPVTVEVKLTGLPAVGLVGLEVKPAVRGCGLTITWTVDVAVPVLASLTVTVIVLVALTA